ncbi:hypothetical protein EUX98_g2779 [Antrodiella citrinella]|uniref:Enoyl reductase (ER) domain-containing protein n=1 Tax=Antrodiella citrinella TaxID=2447956 RepID=A0A4S4N0A6_9APHY|nr:hypothetical protein EUX98_g2779 [Antrodiella citrinella]
MSLPSQQQALFLATKEGKWIVSSIALHKPCVGEILVRVEAAALNPVDWKIRDFGMSDTDHHVILGCDCAGVVVELGEGVTNVAVGDSVLHQAEFDIRRGAFQQYAIASADLVAKIPPNLTFDQAATIPVAMAAAAVGLYGRKVTMGGAALLPPWRKDGFGKYAGEPIVIVGGATSVGQCVIQLAKISGFSPIITTASPHNTDFLKSLGATHIIDRSADIPATLKTITTSPITLILDVIAQPETQNWTYSVLAKGGTLIVFETITLEKTVVGKVARTPWAFLHDGPNRELGVELMESLTSYLATDAIKPNAVEVLPNGLASIPIGLERIRSGQVSAKKLVVHPQETPTPPPSP